MEWQPIETAPKDGTVIIGQEAGTSMGRCWMFAAAVQYQRNMWCRENNGGGFAVSCKPVRWIPMPVGGVTVAWAEGQK